jgi:mannosyltransferase
MVVAAILLLPTLGAASYWFDEAFSVQGAGGSLAQLRAMLTGSEINMALYYGLLWIWTRVGTDEAWVRLLSALSVVASLVPLWLLGRRLGGARVAAVACLLLAVNAFVIRYGQEARAYGLLLLLATSSTWLLVRALDRGTRRDWIFYAFVAVLIPWTQVLGGCLLVGHAGIALGWRPRPRIRSLLLPACIVAIGIAPIAGLSFLALDTAVNWVPPLSGRRVLEVLLDLTGAGRPALAADAASWVLLILSLGLAAVGAVAAFRPTRLAGGDGSGAAADTPGSGRRLALVGLAWVTLPLLAVLALSVIKPLLFSRYLIVVLPGLALLIASGLAAIRPRPLGAAAAIVLVGFALIGTARYLEAPGKSDWRGATERIAATAAPDDVWLTVESWAWQPVELYASMTERERFPTRLARDVDGDGLDAMDPGFPDDLRRLAGALADEGRDVWIVSVPTSRIGLVDGNDERFRGLRERYRVASVEQFDLLVLTRMTPASPVLVGPTCCSK